MAVTEQQIRDAAEQIAAQGDNPTLEGIRQITGGSYTTISPVLRSWKAAQVEQRDRAVDPIPEDLAERMQRLGVEVWAEARRITAERMAGEREALEQTRADMEAEQRETAELADRLTQARDTLQTQLEQTEAQLAEAKVAQRELATERERRQELRADLEGERERSQAAEAKVAEALERAGRLEGELQALRRTDKKGAKKAARKRPADKS